MRNLPFLFAAAAVLALCGGCASSSGAMKVQPSSYRAALDTETIAAVESAAGLSGARVTWVHPPRKAKKSPK